MEKLRLVPSYCQRAFDEPYEIVRRLKEEMPRLPMFDTIVGTGLSGCVIVPYVARAPDRDWALVRKDDSSHSRNKIEGTVGSFWLFLDDLISSGHTLRRVRSMMDTHVRDKHEHHTIYVGTWEYEPERFCDCEGKYPFSDRGPVRLT